MIRAKNKPIAVLILFFLFGLVLPQAGRASAEKEVGRFVVKDLDNPVFHSNELFRAFENFYHPRVKYLREKYKPGQVLDGETDEFKRILLLRNWVHKQLIIDDDNPTPIRPDTFAILDSARAGGKFHCAHASIVLHAVLNSYGYVARRLGVGPGLTAEEFDGHHGTNEVWVNSLAKWVAVDAKYDLHFEKDGLPLSALEIREEVWQNNAAQVIPAFGPERRPTDPRINDRFWGRWATPVVYRWCSWETSTNRFTAFPAALSSTLVMYDDRIFRNHIWYRNKKKHWAYGTPYLLKTEKRSWIYWTPNVITSKVKIEGRRVYISLESFTPNLQTYQMHFGLEPWRDCRDRQEFELKQDLNRLTFRTLNLFGVAGPEHHIQIEWRGPNWLQKMLE